MKPGTAEPDWEALARYVAGESPAAEREAVRRWLDVEPGRAELLTALDGATRLSSSAASAVDVEAALSRVKARFVDVEVVPIRAAGRWRGLALRAAAVVLVLGGAVLLWRALRSAATTETPLAAMGYSTSAGATDSIRLPDGTGVVLGPGSELAVEAGFGRPERRLTLRGEAFFDVRHDAAHPFTLRAGAALVQDLGTSFGVRSDAEGVRVVVLSGSVVLRDTGQRAARSVTLQPGQVGVLRGSEPPVTRPASTGAELEWRKGRLVFDNASLLRVRDDLRRWYGIELVIADSALAGRHVHATFAGESVPEVLNTLSLLLGARVDRHGDTAVLHLRSARPPAP